MRPKKTLLAFCIFLCVLPILSPSRGLVVQPNIPLGVTLFTPEDGMLTNLNSLNFSFMVADTNLNNCTLFLDDLPEYEFVDVKSNIPYSASIKFSASPHSWTVDCVNTLGSRSRALAYDFEVDNTPPKVTLVFLPPSNLSPSNPVLFTFDVDEPHLDTCILYGNWTGLQTSVVPNLEFIPLDSTNSSYAWNVLCNDTAGNYAFAEDASSLFIFRSPEVSPQNVSRIPLQQLPKANITELYEEPVESELECWTGFDNLTDMDIETAGYIWNMVPCPEAVPMKAKDIKKKVWCNGLEVDLEQAAALKVGFVRGKVQFNLELGNTESSKVYCPWCYDTVMDYDEVGVDCGGPSCPSCNRTDEKEQELFKCGDGTCKPNEGCTCPTDCLKKLNLLFPLVISLILILYLVWYMRGRRNKTIHRVVLSLLVLAFIASLLNAVCFCDVYCDNATKIVIMLVVISILSLLVFKSGFVYSKLQRYLSFVYGNYILKDEDYSKISEIKDLIKRSSEALDYDEGTANILYSCIKPLFGSLSPEGKKSVIDDIRKLRTDIRNVSKKEYLNPNLSSKKKGRSL